MAVLYADRVYETTTTSGTGTVSLAGAVAGYQSFTTAFSTGQLVAYTLVDGSNWEVGYGTFTTSGATLSRTTVLAGSSGAGTHITLSGGSTKVFESEPADFVNTAVAAYTVAASSTNATMSPIFFNGTTGALVPLSNSGLTFNPSTGIFSVPQLAVANQIVQGSAGSLGVTYPLQLYDAVNDRRTILNRNLSTGASASATLQLQTGTTNSYHVVSLNDNGGTPYLVNLVGSGITQVYYQMPNYNFQSLGGVAWLTISSGGSVVSSDIGSTYGGLFRLSNLASGATNPTKTMRLNPTGGLEWINNAYTSVLLTLTDAGNVLVGKTSDTGAGYPLQIEGASATTLATTLNNTNSAGNATFQASVASGPTLLMVAEGSGFGSLSYVGNTSNHALTLLTNNIARLSLAAAGNVTVNAPTSGVALAVTGLAGSAFATTITGGNNASSNGLLIQGSYTGNGTLAMLDVEDLNNTNGVNVRLVGNGATTPKKFIRVIGGAFQIINDSYGAAIFTLDDSGNGTFAGTLAAASFPSPTLTGTPVTPTAAVGTNTTQVASTAFVQAATPPLGRRNVLHNGAFQVAQRGTSTNALSTTISYLNVDRWAALQVSGSVAATFTNATSSPAPDFQYNQQTVRSAGNTNTAVIAICQAAETVDSIRLQGSSVTISFWAKAGANYSAASSALGVVVAIGTGIDQSVSSLQAATWTGYSAAISTTVTLTTTWQRFSITSGSALSSSLTQVGVKFTFTPVGTAGADDSFAITGIQLEEGSFATPYDAIPYEVELQICQRFLPAFVAPATGYLFGSAYVNAATSAVGIFQHKVKTRVTTTGITASASNALRFANGGISANSTAVAFAVGGTDCTSMSITSSGMTAGQGGFLASIAAITVIFTGAEM
jgi:hypothetical protein